jgi:hypothetical protein
VGHDLQDLKRALWHLRPCQPFGELAERINHNQAADGPVLDGLTLAALAYILGTDLGCWPRWALSWSNCGRWREATTSTTVYNR